MASSIPTLLMLPTELHHRIFDHLDARTIILSVRNVCTQLHAITDTYYHYHLDFTLISKQEFLRICHVVRPDNVIALTLSDVRKTSDQEDPVSLLVNPRQFPRLRALTLDKTNYNNRRILLQYIITSPINSLTIRWPDPLDNDTLSLLSLTIGQSSVRKLKLMIDHHSFKQISWPVQCTLEYLYLWSRFTFKQFCEILLHSPYLRTLVLLNVPTIETDKIVFSSITPTVYTQLTSLSLLSKIAQMDDIESLLALTPSLVHLTLDIGSDSSRSLLNGFRWEEFISTKLLWLQKFDLYSFAVVDESYASFYMESILASFRTPFWLEEKGWLFTCNYHSTTRYIVVQLLPPGCMHHFDYQAEPAAVSISTAPISVNNGAKMDISYSSK